MVRGLSVVKLNGHKLDMPDFKSESTRIQRRAMDQSVTTENAQKSFPTWFPEGCPGCGEEVNTTLFKGCASSPPTEEDFTPHACSTVPHKRRKGLAGGCIGYALSVFVTKDDARHAQEMFDWAARWHIFAGDVTQDDGRLARTESRLPEHHSFWAYDGVNIKDKFEPALPPLMVGT